MGTDSTLQGLPGVLWKGGRTPGSSNLRRGTRVLLTLGEQTGTRFYFRISGIGDIGLFFHFYDFDTEKTKLADHLAIDPVNTLSPEGIFGRYRRKMHGIKHLALLIDERCKIHLFAGMGFRVLYRYQITVHIDGFVHKI